MSNRVSPQDRWSELLTSAMHTPMEVASDQQTFDPRLTTAPFGAGAIYLANAPRQIVRHSRISASDTRDPAVFLIQMRNGLLQTEADGNKISTSNGECVLVNSTRPFTLTSTQETSGLVVRMPAAWLRQWLPDAEYITSQAIPMQGWGAALAAVTQRINPIDIDQMAVPPGMLAEQIAVLLRLATAPLVIEDRTSNRQQQRIRAVKQAIRDFSHESEVTPLLIAHHLGISRRYLHQILAAGNTTFSREMMSARLTHARNLLANSQTALTVTEVAMHCGFSDSSYFSKCFKKKFGISPKNAKEI